MTPEDRERQTSTPTSRQRHIHSNQPHHEAHRHSAMPTTSTTHGPRQHPSLRFRAASLTHGTLHDSVITNTIGKRHHSAPINSPDGCVHHNPLEPHPQRWRAAHPPLPASKKKIVCAASSWTRNTAAHTATGILFFQDHRRSSRRHSCTNPHHKLKHSCWAHHRSTASPQGRAPPPPSWQEGGCKKPRQIRTPQRFLSPTRGQVPYALHWWPSAWTDENATLAATRKTSGWFGWGERRDVAVELEEKPSSTRNSQGESGRRETWGVAVSRHQTGKLEQWTECENLSDVARHDPWLSYLAMSKQSR